MPPSPAPDLGLDDADRAALHEGVKTLHAWYRATARDLPWRHTRAPYAIWVSETMLQQTRVDTVIGYYERWMRALPSVAALAHAEEAQVLKLWEGLGYYRRARALHRAAKELLAKHGGQLPDDPDAVRALPGVGDYTAAAVLSIAFDHDVAAVDGNVRRVLSRLVTLDADPTRPPASRAIGQLAQDLLPPGTAALHNQAVMELGALVCKARAPACATCPLALPCRAHAAGRPERWPIRTKRRAVPHVDVAIGVVFEGERRERVFIDQRPYDGMLAGLWEFPGGKVEEGETPRQALVRELREEFAMEVEVDTPLPAVRHAYTHLKVTLHPYVCRLVSMRPELGEGRPWRWATLDEVDAVAMPQANRRVLRSLRVWTTGQS